MRIAAATAQTLRGCRQADRDRPVLASVAVPRSSKSKRLDDRTFERRLSAILSAAKSTPKAKRPAHKRRPQTLDEAIRDAVAAALEYHRRDTRWNLSATATSLGIHRSRLRRMVNRYRLKPRARRRKA